MEEEFMQTQVCVFPGEVKGHFVASGVDRICKNPLCVKCSETKDEKDCDAGYEDVIRMYGGAENYPEKDKYINYCGSPSLEYIHPCVANLVVKTINRPADDTNSGLLGRGTLFKTSRATKSLDTHGYEWIYVNMAHRDAAEYATAVAALRKMVLDQDSDANQQKFVRSNLFPHLKKILVKAVGCKSFRFIDDLRYMKYDRVTKNKIGRAKAGDHTDEEVRIRAGMGPKANSMIDLQEEIPVDYIEKSETTVDFRFPGGDGDKEKEPESLPDKEIVNPDDSKKEDDKETKNEKGDKETKNEKGDKETKKEIVTEEAQMDKGIEKVVQELVKIENEEQKVITEEEDLDEVTENDDSKQREEIPKLAIELPHEPQETNIVGQEGVSGIEVETKVGTPAQVRMGGLIDVLGAQCKAGAKALPILHVDPHHAPVLASTRNMAKWQEVYFDGKKFQSKDMQYQEMYNVWIWVAEHFCTTPLAFDDRENADGTAHKNNKDSFTTDVVFSYMKPGDIIVFRTNDAAHTALKITDNGEVCTELNQEPKNLANCRISVELRVMGYGKENSCRGTLQDDFWADWVPNEYGW